MSEFNGITGFEGWSAKLKLLLEETKLVAQQEDLDKRLTMCDRLTDFVLESRPDTPEIKELDRIAKETATALLSAKELKDSLKENAGDKKVAALIDETDNLVICRHVHCVAYNPAENAFYACMGDRNRPEGRECHWLRGTYDAKNDRWRWKVIISDASNSRYKSGGFNFVDDKLYWVADANGPTPYDRGVFRCDPADITRPEAHTMLFNPQYEFANMIIQDGVILAAHYAPASPYSMGFIFSPDMGRTWAQYDLSGFGRRSPVRFHKRNSEGWFRVDLRSGWTKRAEVLFIKPKQVTDRPTYS